MIETNDNIKIQSFAYRSRHGPWVFERAGRNNSPEDLISSKTYKIFRFFVRNYWKLFSLFFLYFHPLA